MHIIVWVALLPIDKYYIDPLLLDRPEILALSTTEEFEAIARRGRKRLFQSPLIFFKK